MSFLNSALDIFFCSDISDLFLMQFYITDEKSKILFSYMLYAYSVKEPIGELNLKIQESFPSFIFFSTGSDSCFWEFHPSSVILGVFVFFFILIFCESLALYAKSRGLIYTILAPKVNKVLTKTRDEI